MITRSFHPLKPLCLVSVAAGLMASAGCGTAFTDPDPDYAFHAGFERGRAHDEVGCDGCHIAGAAQQRDNGLPIPPADASGWVTAVNGSCEGCHPFTANLATPLEPEDCQVAPGSPVLETEFCRFQRYHGNAPPSQGCTGGQCHSVDNQSFAFFSDPVDTDNPATPPQNPHDVAPLSQIFALEGAHVGVGCDECHTGGGGTEAQQQGAGRYCASCHGRVRDETVAGLDHYPPPREGWTDERERDCMSCHVLPADAGDGSPVYPLDWTTYNIDHGDGFPVPHNTVERWADVPPVATPPESWKYQCWSCHNGWSRTQPANPADTQDGTSQSMIPDPVFVNVEEAVTRGNCTDGCHGTIEGVPNAEHGGGDACLVCHPTGGAPTLP